MLPSETALDHPTVEVSQPEVGGQGDKKIATMNDLVEL